MRIPTALLLLALATGCNGKNDTPKGQAPSTNTGFELPQMTDAVVHLDDDPLWKHPWLKRQPHVTEMSPVIQNDLHGIDSMCRQVAKQREAAGFPPGSIEEDLATILKQVDQLQRPLKALHLKPDRSWYSVLSLPDTPQSQYPTPVGFHIHQRLHVDNTDLGFPVFLDLRVFQLDQAPFHERVDTIVTWHKDLLDNPDNSFRNYEISDWKVLVGRGDHNTDHFNPTHGIASDNRGIFLAYKRIDDKLYLLYMDAPREIFDKHQTKLMAMIP